MTNKTKYRNSFFHLILLGVILSLTGLLSLNSCRPGISSLPFLGEHEVVQKNIDGKIISDTILYRVPDFILTDQDSLPFTQDLLNEKVYVAYFFFTSCPATCPIMTNAMKRVYKVVGENPGFEIVAHTIDPKRDTPQKLRKFAEKNEVLHENWHFVTADMEYLYDLGIKGYYLSMGQHDQAPGGYIHSAKFILVDRQGHLRGFYEGTDAEQVARMIEGIQFLLGE